MHTSFKYTLSFLEIHTYEHYHTQQEVSNTHGRIVWLYLWCQGKVFKYPNPGSKRSTINLSKFGCLTKRTGDENSLVVHDSKLASGFEDDF